jgi:DNA-binding GntR family transcriptional regulator
MDKSTPIAARPRRFQASPDEAHTQLQRRLAGQITDWMKRERLPPGAPINQLQLAERFGVSRTPVKAALQALSDCGTVRFLERGVQVADLSSAPPTCANRPDAIDDLIFLLAAERHRGALQQEVTESDLMRRYSEPRAAIVAALRRLAELGVVERKPGFGWRFIAAETHEEKRASYSFRLAIEPTALLEPGYQLDPAWASEMRQRHLHFLNTPWRNSDAMAFFEMNGDFHLGIVRFSQNRFFAQATDQQNSLRRLRNYSWRLGPERVAVSCREHLAILAALGADQRETAAELLRQHLTGTLQLISRSRPK